MYIYEGVRVSTQIATVINRGAGWVRTVRSRDGWDAFAQEQAARQTAERHGLALPFMLRTPTIELQRAAETDERGTRAGSVRAEINRILAEMARQESAAAPAYYRLVCSVGALQKLLDSLLGMDVAKRVGQAAAISRAKLAARPRVMGKPGGGSFKLPAASAAPIVEPDLQVIMP